MTYGTVNADLLSASNGESISVGSGQGLINRIINGDCRIDQRNAGASVTISTGGIYTLDRFVIVASQASKLSCQQNAGSVTPPVGFTNYLGLTSLSAYSITSTDYFTLQQGIEGYNMADLGWGTANAKTVTLSFQVYSSLTGTFGGALYNSAGDRSYPFTYSIPVANTWTTISVTIAGDTTGTWVTNNGVGVRVNWGLGVGSTISGTAGAWAGTLYRSATGATSIVGTNGATFYITGVSLQKGTQATSFEYRQYGQELAFCQRYFISYGGGNVYETFALGYGSTTTNAIGKTFLPVEMRALPTATITASGTLGLFDGVSVVSVTAITVDQPSSKVFNANFSAASGLTAHRPVGVIANNNINARMLLSAEL